MAHITDNNMLKEFNRKMRTLEENGIFTAQKRSVVPNTRYLIISYGGTGVDALFEIRRAMKKYLTPAQCQQYVRFLSIDTDKQTMQHTETITLADGTKKVVVTDSLDQKEFFWLDGTPAKGAVTLTPEIFKDWMNPEMPGKISADTTFLNGDGASGTRQIGRLTLFPATISSALQHRITTLAGELTHDTADELRVMIITGISGGTGSGTVIDATYLIRDAITKMPGAIGAKTRYIGFVMLPPTGDAGAAEDIRKKGNRNGYAALKEINQFMTLSYRGERYEQRFGSVTVSSDKNIFDTCYLLDGVTMGIVRSDPRGFVKNVLSECIVDMITSQPVQTGTGTAPRAVDSLMSDALTFASAMVASKGDEDAPRDADYIYCVLGHGNVSIPLDLIKTYVAKLLFDKMYHVFSKFQNVDEDDVEDFIKEVRVKPFSPKEQQMQINASVAERFTDYRSGKGGPFYVINLLFDAARLAEEKQNGIFVSAQAKEQLQFMANYFRELNNRYFNVFTQVMEEMKRILTKDYNLICEGGHYTTNGYTFSPICLEDGVNATQVIKDYMGDLVTNKQVLSLMDNLLKTMIANRDVWGQLLDKDGKAGAFDGATEIRKFWNAEMNKIVDSTVEDFLIKVYSGDKNAKYEVNDPTAGAALQAAAKAIYDNMFGVAGVALPTAELDINLGLTMANFNGHNMMLVPKQAPHLRDAIQAYADTHNSNVKVYSSEAGDQISCYAQYTSIPAFKFKWVQTAEPNYEAALDSAGLHMSETTGGNQWRDFPNLLPKSTWKGLGHYTNKREAKLADRAEQLFYQAKDLGLTSSSPMAVANVLQYAVKSLPESMMPDLNLFKEYDIRDQENAAPETIADRNGFMAKIEEQAMEMAKQLYASVPVWGDTSGIVQKLEAANPSLFVAQPLKTTEGILSVPHKPAGWDEIVAARFLRKMPDLMVSMRGTILVIECLKKLIERDMVIVDFAKYTVAGLFTYNEDVMEWEYTGAYGQETLFSAEFNNKVQEIAAHYFMYREFAQNAEAIKAALEPLYEEASGAGLDKKSTIAKMKALTMQAAALKEENLAKLKFVPSNPDKYSMLGSAEFRKMAALKGYDQEEIFKFYLKLNDTLSAIYGV